MPQILSEYYPPEYESTAFNCPYCGAYAKQNWHPLSWDQHHVAQIKTRDMRVSLCSHCQEASLWLSGLSPACPPQMIYPATRTSPPANDDLDDNIKKIYYEAADIANLSPRAACALLRLAIQMLLKQLGETGDNINNDIKNLVAKELDPKIQQALDIVRVTGNHAVHPGEIDFDETTDVQALFDLINVIADTLITRPKRIETMFNRLPQKDKESIKKRDNRTV